MKKLANLDTYKFQIEKIYLELRRQMKIKSDLLKLD